MIAEFSPILWYPSQLVQVMSGIIGEERANRFWQTKSLLDAGTHIIYGSDWPSVVPDPNPWPGIEAMVTRRDPYGVYPGALGAEQAVDLETALRIFTIDGAVAGKHEDRTGTIEVGKSADFIVLDRNLLRDSSGGDQRNAGIADGGLRPGGLQFSAINDYINGCACSPRDAPCAHSVPCISS